jgi:AraC-like DNA-binding protein
VFSSLAIGRFRLNECKPICLTTRHSPDLTKADCRADGTGVLRALVIHVDSRIQFMLKVIEERTAVTALTSAEAGRLFGLSEARVRRLFHCEVGTTFARYIRQRRLARASVLLQDCALPIKQIANDCGYEDISNFYRDFRQTYGVTPRILRMRKLSAALPHIGASDSDQTPFGYKNRD